MAIAKLFVALLSAALLVIPAFAAAPLLDTPRPGDVTIGDWTYGGTGCPGGTAWLTLSPDRRSFTANFRSFTAYLNTDTGNVDDSRKFCQLNLAINSPPGWQYFVVQTGFTGYASLSDNVQAVHTSTVYFSGSSNEQSHNALIYGPAYRDYDIRSPVAVGSGNWSPCGTQSLLNIKSTLRLRGQGYGAIRELKASGSLGHIYNLEWRTC
ncbi:hypothetical protein DRE_02721 [Drechslerella stenobrocha 248]|uniref:DUF4360 domain-containing protein n=1 Tax=Drechslerella stenobrocha 248 TaxID=1043628 RepID=W7HWC7_9PEZI|nr:hypothetical protein DRE_02721 [Drechslerella stenobrocha 248]